MTNSILDTDLYKLTMQQAVLQKFPNAKVKYTFINRGEHKFTKEMIEGINTSISYMSMLSLSKVEKCWLKNNCSFFSDAYIAYLNDYRFDLKEVSIKSENENLIVDIEGPWHKTILWEVPLMAIISEVFHTFNGDLDGYDPTYEMTKTEMKMSKIEAIGAKFAEFGTRRRFSKDHQDMVISQLSLTCENTLIGSSNVEMAMKYDLKPIGTQAHEWFMFHGAAYGYLAANELAMDNWVDVFNGELGIALSDTFTTDEFFRVFSPKYAKLFDGLRQDSGDASSFLYRTNKHYRSIGVDPKHKLVVFSDGLDIHKIEDLYEKTKEADGVTCSFGIGTNLTCDVEDVRPMNMVIKMSACKPNGDKDRKWLDCVKLSDSPGKYTGVSGAVKLCLETIKGSRRT